MSVSLELRLDERHSDRVLVTVLVNPDAPEARVDGVAIELVSLNKEPIGPRMLLPIAGVLAGPVCTRVELRAPGSIPIGATLRGHVWWGEDQVFTTLPADPYTELEAHVRGKGGLRPCRSAEKFRALATHEMDRLRSAFAWLAGRRTPIRSPEPELELTEEVTEELGLTDEDAAFLRELLNEP